MNVTGPDPSLSFQMAVAQTSAETPQYGYLRQSEQNINPPFESNNETNAYASALPHASCLIVNLRPSSECKLLELRTIGLREELLHGARQQFGLTRNVHLLQQQSIATLYEYLRGDTDTSAVEDILVPSQIAVHEIIENQRGFLEAIDQYLKNQAIGEETALRRDVESVIDTTAVDPESVLGQLKERQQELETNRTEARSEEVYESLHNLGETYSPSIAQAAADMALDISYTLGPVDITGIPSEPLVDSSSPKLKERLQTRLHAAIEAVHTHDDPTLEASGFQSTLRKAVREADPAATQPAGEEETIHDIELLLLDEPERVADPDTRDPIRAGPTSLDQVLSSAFQLPGNFGGVVFWNGDDDPNWLVNPLISAEGYREQWESSYAGEMLLEQLRWNYWGEDGNRSDMRTTAMTAPSCPMCDLTSHGSHPSCPFDELVGKLEEEMRRLVDSIRFADNSTFGGRLITQLNDQYGGSRDE